MADEAREEGRLPLLALIMMVLVALF